MRDINTKKLSPGEQMYANEPIIGITGKGAKMFIWIGNDADNDKRCFATLSGAKRLESLACGILTALGHNATAIKKSIYSKSKRKNTNQ